MAFDLFTDFLEKPSNVRFDHQEDDETIELFLRQHFIVNLPWVVFSIFALFLPFLIFQIDFIFNLNFFAQVPSNLILSALIIYFLVITGYMIESYLHWYFNIYIVTNMHLVDINFHTLLSREIIEVRLEDVQSQSSKIQGFFKSIFHFGDVVIETAGERQRITFLNVPKPDAVADRIQDLTAVQERESNAF
ncbi:hypothetical protein A2688_03160 [Candidatus Daviesbacteria bacterium RIFCSPHIGHO2_01_FULL_38_8]|nr:MAG: hypothetical protein A2688_03160 [Candidatus Daviesbacteria bacterium RIFCSPHIGHO2_01_FULL_38_8]